ncbi:MAG: hypothetical protein AAF514_18235, partial [Verrucomicrobiota bacterium]
MAESSHEAISCGAGPWQRIYRFFFPATAIWFGLIGLTLAEPPAHLVAGPMLGHVAEESSRIWVAVSGAATVDIRYGEVTGGAIQRVREKVSEETGFATTLTL